MIVAAAQAASAAGDVTANVANHVRMACEAATHGAQLVVFPELSLTGYELRLAASCVVSSRSGTLDPLRQVAEDCGLTVVAGAPVANARGGLFIGALVFRPGEAVSVYMKVHVHASERHVFAPGEGGPLLAFPDAQVALAICADASHPEHAAGSWERGAQVYAASVMIVEEEYERKAALMARYAAEHQMATVLANSSGSNGGFVSAGRSAIWRAGGTLAAIACGAGVELVVADTSA